MAMVPFYTRFKDLAFKEMRIATVQGMPDLPDGEYGYLEFYCDDPACDCRRVIIDVITPTSGNKAWAVIGYGWESLEFYETRIRDKETARKGCGAMLDPLNPQSEYAVALLRLFTTQVLQDQAYVERLKRHYLLFKSALQMTRKPVTQSRKKKKTKRKR